MRRNNSKQDEYWKESVHTPITYWFGIIAVGIEFFLGFRHIDSLFGQLALVEAFFGLSGLLILDFIHGTRGIYPKKFKKIKGEIVFRFAITFGVIAGIQFLFQVIPLITSTEMAMAIAFAAVCEELFFRGVLMEPFFRYAKKIPRSQKIRIWKNKKTGEIKEITYLEIFGIMMNGIIFSFFHINYYGNPNLIFMVMFGGSWLAGAYFWWKDLTASMLAHFLLNIIFIYQFYKVML